MSKKAQLRDEARLLAASKEYDYCVLIYPDDKSNIYIFASQNPSGKEKDCRYKHVLHFKKHIKTGKKFLNCYKLENQTCSEQMWKIELDSSMDLEDLAKNYYHKLDHLWCKKNVTQLEDTEQVPDEEILKNLEGQPLECQKDCVADLSFDELFHITFSKWNQPKENDHELYYLYSPFAQMDIKDFLELEDPRIFIHISNHTEEHLADFIKSWKEGNIRENFDWCIWNTDNSEFDRKKLVELLNCKFEENQPIVFQQTVEPKKFGRLYLNPQEIRFFTEDPIEEVSNVEKLKSAVSHSFHRALHFLKTLFKSPISEKKSKLGEDYP